MVTIHHLRALLEHSAPIQKILELNHTHLRRDEAVKISIPTKDSKEGEENFFKCANAPIRSFNKEKTVKVSEIRLTL